MPDPESKLNQARDAFLEALDDAPTDGSLFAVHDDKEHYETKLMYSYRKWQAAQYHRDRVNTLLDEEEHHADEYERLKKVAFNTDALGEIQVNKKFTMTREASEYVYELAAFLDSLKSAVDFLAALALRHFPGLSGDSIRTLIRQVEKGATGPVFDAVKTHLSWVSALREYRHHVIHRRIMTASSTTVSLEEGGAQRTARHPIVVPQDPPRYVPDTRNALRQEMADTSVASEGLLICVTRVQGSSTVSAEASTGSFPNATPAKGQIAGIHIEPAPGYVTIQDLMQQHLESFEQFYIDFLADLLKLSFATSKS